MEGESEAHSRENWIDITRGLAIIIMIIGHSISNQNAISWIWSFHMPLFFIITGYTMKEISWESLLGGQLKTAKIYYYLV